MSSALYGLVLAGGQSRRMGRDKALLVRDGQSQLRHIASLADSVTDKFYVSARADQKDDPERSQFETIVDRYDDMGPIAGVLSAMDEYPDVAWLVVACDLPNLDDATISNLLDGHTVKRPFTAFTSSHDGLPEPLCAIYGVGARKLDLLEFRGDRLRFGDADPDRQHPLAFRLLE